MRRIESMLLATIVTIVFLVVVTIATEQYAPLNDWLKATFYHHWIGKGVLSLVLFAAISLSPLGLPLKTAERYLIPIVWLSVLALFAFFVWRFL